MPLEPVAAYEARERVWQLWTTIRFLAGYLGVSYGTPLVPPEREDLHALLTAYVLDKALYEVRYDLEPPARLGRRSRCTASCSCCGYES